MYLIDGLIVVVMTFFCTANDRRTDGADEIVRRELPWRTAGGIGCRAAPDALTRTRALAYSASGISELWERQGGDKALE